jgi:phospholipid/cholesterol/gamma-HCH transport system substrate-binding protein
MGRSHPACEHEARNDEHEETADGIPGSGGKWESGARGARLTAARVATIGALIVGAVLAFLVLFGGGGGHTYNIVFETGGQLVKGNQVLIGGQPFGTIDSIDLTDDGQANVEVTVDEPLHEGTTAVVRATSLSGVANRYISISPGPNNSPQLDDGATLTTQKTTTPVDLDQLFDTLNAKTRRGLADFIQGYGTVYTGNTEQANQTYKYFAPGLQATDRLLRELTRDQQTFSEFLVSSSRALGAVAERRNDLSALTSNANQMLGAIAQENSSLDRSLVALPPAMRQANTTFVNLRAALDDLTPLVNTSKKATKNLTPFLRDLRPVVNEAVPVVTDLRFAVNTPGGQNDLTDVLRDLPGLRKKAHKASKTGIRAMDDTQPNLAQLRAYSPDVLGFVTKLGQLTSYYDGDGHYARVMPTLTGAFQYDALTSQLNATTWPPTSAQFAGADVQPNGYERCPGSATQVATDLSNPFINPPIAGGLPATDCDPTAIPPGP